MNAYTAPPRDLSELAAIAVRFAQGHASLIEPYLDKPALPPVVDALANAALEALGRTLEAMAATPARTSAERTAKAMALRETFVGGCVEGDHGLAWSLVEDIIHAHD